MKRRQRDRAKIEVSERRVKERIGRVLTERKIERNRERRRETGKKVSARKRENIPSRSRAEWFLCEGVQRIEEHLRVIHDVGLQSGCNSSTRGVGWVVLVASREAASDSNDRTETSQHHLQGRVVLVETEAPKIDA